MKRKNFMILFRLFILLAPLLYCSMGHIFSPLFFLLMVLLSWVGFKQPRQTVEIPYKKPIRYLFYSLPVLPLIQIVPLPRFVLELVSPGTVRTLAMITDTVPEFHSISLAPYETLIFAFQMAAIGLFFLMVISLEWTMEEMVTLLNTVVYAALGLLAAGLTSVLAPEVGRDSLHFSFFLVMVFPLSLALVLMHLRFFAIRENLLKTLITLFFRERNVVFSIAVSAVLGLGIAVTVSGYGKMVLMVSVLLYLLWVLHFKFSRRLRRRLRMGFIIVTLFIAFVILFPVVKDTALYQNHPTGDGAKWLQSATMLKTFPVLGTGYGTWHSIDVLFDRAPEMEWPLHFNNGYMQLLVEGGIVGSIPFFLLVLFLNTAVIKFGWKRRHPQVRALMLGLLTVSITAILYFVFTASLLAPANMMILVLIAGLSLKIVNHERSAKREKIDENIEEITETETQEEMKEETEDKEPTDVSRG